MPSIASVSAREIFHSGAFPTIEVALKLSDGTVENASTSISRSKSAYEAKDVFDQDVNRYHGKGVLKGVTEIVNIISSKLHGIEVFEQQKIDGILNSIDGTEDKSVLGANITLPVSCAVAKAASKASAIPLFLYLRQFTSLREAALKLPLPMFSIVEGGKWLIGGIDFRSILILPASSQDVYSSIEMGIDLFHSLEAFLEDRNIPALSAPFGGYPAMSQSNTDAVALVKQCIEGTQYKFSEHVFLGIDVHANTLLNGQSYRIIDRVNPISSQELADFYKILVSEYGVIFLEDPFGDADAKSWSLLSESILDKVMISGHDLIGGNPIRLQTALEQNLINAVSFHPGQIGTVSEALAFAEIARFKKIKLTVYDRAFATDDTFIVDFGVAVGADYLKCGAPSRERITKYNRLLGIEKEIELLK